MINLKTKWVFILVSLFLSFASVHAQAPVEIPACTAYALPAEEQDANGDSRMFAEKTGIHNWTDAARQVQFFFRLKKTGMLELAISLKNDKPGNTLQALIAGKKFTIAVPVSKKFTRVRIGSITVNDTGFYSLTLSSIKKNGDNIADIQSLMISGPASADVHFNPVARRNAASVHLFYPLDDSVKVISFYNEITVPENADPLHSYYMACGFARGYFGMQVNSPTERRIIFSVWDAGNEAADRTKVAEENKVKLMAKGEDVYADGFGNEGTGGHSHWIYPWKTGITYRFMVTSATDSASQTTSYAGYFFVPELQKWKLIACFKAPKDGKPLRKLYSFVENFEGNNGQLYRKAWFNSPWIRNDKGEWRSIEKATFSYDATGKAGDRIDYGGGTDSNRFYLWNGGFKPSDAQFGNEFKRIADKQRPVIDLYKNVDSAIQYEKDRALILDWIRSGRSDTTGSVNGLYYYVLKEGTGDYVTINDTLTVHYKGSLLNGEVFDQSKDKPAEFPLKRLIRGWQMGLPFCRAGGKIRLIIPSYLAYSIRNLGVIPPNNPLVFDIEVLEVKKGKP